MSMDKHIEQYSERRDSIKQELEKLKTIVDETLKQKKKREVLAQINTLKKEMEWELSTSLSEEDKKKIEEINKSLDPLVSQELSDLQQEVKTEEQLNKENPPKIFREKTKDLFSFKDPISSGKGILSVAWVAIGWRSLWKLFKGRTEEEKKEHEKKWRWWRFGDNLWRGTKIVSWWIAGFFWFQWLKNWFTWEHNADMTDEQDQQLKDWLSYMKNNPEQAKKYMTIWTNVDQVYDHIMQKEKNAWREYGLDLDTWYTKYADASKIDKQTFQGIVPFCIDQEFGSVEELLSEGWYYSYLREKTWEELKWIISWLSTKALSAMMPYIKSLTSFGPFLNTPDDKTAVTTWLDSWTPTERQSELDLFFRQYGKVVVYMHDKKNALVEHIASQKFQSSPGEFSDLEQAKSNQEWMQTYVYWDTRYKNFYQWNMRNAYDVLSQENMMNSKLSHGIESIVSWSDAIRSDILQENNWKDILIQLEQTTNSNKKLSPELQKDSIEACEDTLEDIEDNFDETVTYPYLSAIDVAFNTQQNNVQEYLKESWLLWFKNSFKQLLIDYKTKFDRGIITSEEIKQYVKISNEYFAFKKEILIAAQSFQDMKSENTSPVERSLQVLKAVWRDFLKATYDGCVALGNWEFIKWWILISPAILLTWSLIAIKMPKTWNFIKKINAFHVGYEVWKYWTNKLSYLNKACDLPSNILRVTRYNTPKWYQLLLKDVMEWRISDEKLEKIIAKSPKIWDLDKTIPMNDISDFLKQTMNLKIDSTQAKLLFGKESKFTILHNDSVRKLLFSQTKKTTLFDNLKLQHTLYNYNKTADFKKVMKSLQTLDTKYNALSWEQKKFVWLIMDDMKIDSIKKLNLISDNIDRLNLSGMNYEQLKKLMNELSKNIDIITDQNKLNKIIDDIKHVDDVVDNLSGHRLWNFLDAELEQLDNAIPKPSNLDAQKSRIQNLRKELQTLEKSELDQLWDMWSAIKQVDKNHDVISSLSDLSKMWNATPDKKVFAQAMSEFDGDALRKLNIVWWDVTDEMIERVAKMMEEIKWSRWIIKADYMESMMKTVFKVFSKLT